ncbi:MAG: helix-turn-helix domain-containing protein [Actinomycetota bacterium]|nr:helix-turn-helix domain-containing protein [Actinomycetota bacterium]
MEELWDIARVAEYLGVTERTVYNKVRGGDLPAVKVGRLWRVRPSDLEAWLSSRATAASPATFARESTASPSRGDLERLLTGLEDSVARRMAFVGLLTRAVESLGWPAPVIVGGNAVEFYTAGGYATMDIDVAGASEPLAQVLSGWGFLRKGRHWYDDALALLIEAPGGALGAEQLAHVATVDVRGVRAHVLGIEDLIVDRLCACVHWADEESCAWAGTLLSTVPDIDMDYLRRRAAEEEVSGRLSALEETTGL